MAWYNEAVFYHIYPLGLVGAPKKNEYGAPADRLNSLIPWIDHIREIGCNALYIGPLFESASHGYDTTDYHKVDNRLGTNEDLKNYVKICHEKGIRVILDGVFNHTGRDFFAFKDIQKNRENSRYVNWYCNVNFYGNNEYNDGFSYDNWGGYNLMAKLNQRNPEVVDYICNTIRFWVDEFDIDGLRLDAADVLDFDFMKALRRTANEVKPDFWLMGEVIHGQYDRWVNEEHLHSVTNYQLHKALYSGHNSHNYFEIAHNVRYVLGMFGGDAKRTNLYNFVDNHDVERIYTKLTNKAHFAPVHVLLYTLPGVPSIYYGSEYAIEGKKEPYSDDSLRPCLHLEDFGDAIHHNPATSLISKLGEARQKIKALSYGDYQELLLRNSQYAFARSDNGAFVITTVNCDDSDYVMTVRAENAEEYVGVLSGQHVRVEGGNIAVNIPANSGEIWIPSWLAEQIGTLETNQAVVTETSDLKAEDSQTESLEATDERKEEPAKTESVPEAEESSVVEETVTEEAEENSVVEETVIKGTEAEEESAEEIPSKEEILKNAEKTTDQISTQITDTVSTVYNEAFEKGKIAGLQQAVLALMSKNGPITDQMKKDVEDNVYVDSLINWIKSF